MTKTVDDLMELASEAVDSHLRFAIAQALAEAHEEALNAANRMMRAAIRLEEQAQPEPVAWMARTQDWSEPNDTSWQYGPWVDGLDARFIPLYAHPPRAEPAPELTNEEIEAVISGMNRKLTGFQGWGWLDVARALLKAQKEKT